MVRERERNSESDAHVKSCRYDPYRRHTGAVYTDVNSKCGILMKTTSYIQWYNENEGRAYPISETASRVSDSGSILPDNIIADLGLMLDPSHTDVRISSVRITPRLVTVGISSASAGLLVGTFVRDALQPYIAYPLTGVVDNVSGWVVFGTHQAVTTEDYRFATAAQSGVEARAIRYVEALPVQGILKDGGRLSAVLRGVVRLRGGAGVTVTKDPYTPQTILVSLTSDIIHNIISPCNFPATRNSCSVAPIRTINGVGDASGNITVRFK